MSTFGGGGKAEEEEDAEEAWENDGVDVEEERGEEVRPLLPRRRQLPKRASPEVRLPVGPSDHSRFLTTSNARVPLLCGSCHRYRPSRLPIGPSNKYLHAYCRPAAPCR